ncbi:MAG: DUF4760 domain-containing protein [Janthinobacterium lividum]
MFQEVYNIQEAVAAAPASNDVSLKEVLLAFGPPILAALIALIVAWYTLRHTLEDYEKQSLEKRAKQYLDIRDRYQSNERYQAIVSQAHAAHDFSAFSHQERVEYMAFFEDLQFLINSGLIKDDVIYYMFGADIIQAWDSEDFCVLWDNKNKAFTNIKTNGTSGVNENFTLLDDFVKGAKAFKESGEIARRIQNAKL